MIDRRWLIAGSLLAALTGACDQPAPAEPDTPPPSLPGSWRGTHLRGTSLPAALHVFDPFIENGQPISVHWLVDSATIVMQPTGRYEHRIRVSEWGGAAGGPPEVLRLRLVHGDFGTWQRDGETIRFESEWLQNHRMTGSFGSDGVLNMQHGFGHGDPPVAFRYGK